MWMIFALCSAGFAGATAILAKIGIKDTDSNLATAIRTVVIVIFSWLMVFIVGSQGGIYRIEAKTLLFLVLSGIATGASWLCYFTALRRGEVSRVAAIDKSSIIFTMLFAFLVLGEDLGVRKLISIALIIIGTYLMLERKKGEVENEGEKRTGKAWMLYAFGSAIFASLTAVLGKIGIDGVESNLGTAIRTVVVLMMAWIMVFVSKKQYEIRKIDKKSWLFICLSGITTGLSWLCYYRALQMGQAGIVVMIDKLSIVVTAGFSFFILKERMTRKSVLGILLITGGILWLLI